MRIVPCVFSSAIYDFLTPYHPKLGSTALSNSLCCQVPGPQTKQCNLLHFSLRLSCVALAFLRQHAAQASRTSAALKANEGKNKVLKHCIALKDIKQITAWQGDPDDSLEDTCLFCYWIALLQDNGSWETATIIFFLALCLHLKQIAITSFPPSQYFCLWSSEKAPYWLWLLLAHFTQGWTWTAMCEVSLSFSPSTPVASTPIVTCMQSTHLPLWFHSLAPGRLTNWSILFSAKKCPLQTGFQKPWKGKSKSTGTYWFLHHQEKVPSFPSHTPGDAEDFGGPDKLGSFQMDSAPALIPAFHRTLNSFAIRWTFSSG